MSVRHVHVEHVAAQADQCQEELNDQHGSADGGTDDKYGSHRFHPPRRRNATEAIHDEQSVTESQCNPPHIGGFAG